MIFLVWLIRQTCQGELETRGCIGGRTENKRIAKEKMTSLSRGSWTLGTDPVRR